MLPATGAGFAYAFLLAFSHHGAHTIRTLFGDVDAAPILQSVSQNPIHWNRVEQEAVARFPDIFRPVLREWRGFRVEAGLPLIPAALILSRTKHGDFALPFLSILFFAMHPFERPIEQTDYWRSPILPWPPTAAFTVVMLPYIRGLYNEGMERLFGEQERAWAKEVRPRLGSEEGNETDGAVDHEHEQTDEDSDVEEVLRIEVDLGMDEEDDQEQGQREGQPDAAAAPTDDNQEHGQEQDQPPPAEDIAHALDAVQEENVQPPQDQQQAQEPQQEGQQPNQEAEQQPQQPQQPERRHNIDIGLFTAAYNILDTAFGAMMFPTVAAASGEILKVVMPRSWVSLPPSPKEGLRSIPTGLLQTKWGRSIVGGCLFVVLKDAVRIYSRWRMAVSYRERRVKDYDKGKGEYVV